MKSIYLFLSVFVIAGAARGEIRIGGSDLLASHFAPALAAYAESRGIEAKVEFHGSYSGLEGLKNGSIDLAIIAVPDGKGLPEGGFRKEYLGAKVAAVMVSEANPVSQVTLRQLGGIFGESEATNLTRWGQLGLGGEWSARSVVPSAVSSAEHTLTLDLFRHTVLQSRPLRRGLVEADGIETIRRRLQQDTQGIALLHRVPADLSGMKILDVARGDADIAYGPSANAIASNDYPLRLPLYLVFPEAEGAKLKDLLRFIASEEAAEALAETGLVALPGSQRQRLYFEFERL